MYRRILVATDLTESSRPALQTGLELAHRLGAKLEILHVVEPPYRTRGWYSPYSADENTFLQGVSVRQAEAAQRVLDDQVKEADRESKVQVKSVVKVGVPADSIIETAKDSGADLVVVGTHARQGFQHVFLGSIAERVVRTAPCPVLTVRAEGRKS
jgi:nucleotide-binding universal stress UspA family protein